MARDLDLKLAGKIEEIKPRMQLKGFRPGKVPTAHLKKTFGKQMMSEIVEQTVSETSQQADQGQQPEARLPAARRPRRASWSRSSTANPTSSSP